MGGYGAWLIIPLVVGSDLTPSIKTALTAVLGATPLLTKLLAIALLGRPNDRLPKKAFSNCFFDEMIPVQNSYWLSANLPNAVLLTYPDSGHGSLFQFHEFFHAAGRGILGFRLGVCALLSVATEDITPRE